MKIRDILEVTDGKLILGNLENECDNFCKDTRIIKNGDTYIGIKGENFDGNTLWKSAFENGAETVILENIDFEKEDLEKYEGKNIIIVDNTMKAIAAIARYKRMLLGEKFPLVAITGSVGKTSTKDIVANVVNQKLKTLKTEGNNNNEIGLPFTLFRLKDHKAAVIEMGMNHFKEIERLTKIARPTISVITNIGTSHIGNLGSRANILKAKLEILEGMDKKILVINNDNDLLNNFYLKNQKSDIEIHTYGIENSSEIMAEDIKLEEKKSKFVCNIDGEKHLIEVPVGGIHFVYNALCAISVGKLLNLNIEEIKKGIRSFELTKKRMDLTELKNGATIINDSYNASFESMQASLKYLNNFKENRKIAVLGDMFELGEFSKELHEKVGKEVVENDIDILICAGKDAKYIAEAARKSGMNSENIFYFEEKDKILDILTEKWKKGDYVLFKASNGMKFYEIAEKLIKEN